MLFTYLLKKKKKNFIEANLALLKAGENKKETAAIYVYIHPSTISLLGGKLLLPTTTSFKKQNLSFNIRIR